MEVTTILEIYVSTYVEYTNEKKNCVNMQLFCKYKNVGMQIKVNMFTR